ncbi:MAG: hypothetical protein JWR50_4221 [Mucilaginibacter sp.]|nr:hypothetical protein [Mucilaginibacter sp.]
MQTVLTIVTAIEPSRKNELEKILSAIQQDLYGNSYIPFGQFSLLHFASFVIIQDISGNPLLVFENNFDGDLSTYLDELLAVAGNGIDQIYSCCSGYDPTKNKAFLTAHVVLPNAYHIGNTGRKARDIAGNRQLRLALQDYLDGLKLPSLSATTLRKDMQSYTRTLDPDLSVPLPPHQTRIEKVMPWVNLVLFGIVFLALLPIDLIAVIILRYKEKRDASDTAPEDPNQVGRLMETENQIAQNHLASITAIKPGWFRLRLLRFTLFAVNLLARISNKGKLSGIPSIHFAHWSIINNNQLLFLSNFDGSWSSYLDDFIDKASHGLTAVWSNTVGFPKTRFLILDGATDEFRFKAYARGMQVPSLVWFSAYPDLTVQNIDKDSKIRENVLTDLSEAETKTWLKLF